MDGSTYVSDGSLVERTFIRDFSISAQLLNQQKATKLRRYSPIAGVRIPAKFSWFDLELIPKDLDHAPVQLIEDYSNCFV